MLVDLTKSWTPDLHLPDRAVADVQALPLESASEDVVLATHMLYHVLDIAEAVREIRRVLRPGGVFLAVTNAEDHTRELYELYAAALKALNVDEPLSPKASHREGKRCPVVTRRLRRCYAA
jgi:ubiquinone/menaquinone biosynthesis C-methylase UbiE